MIIHAVIGIVLIALSLVVLAFSLKSKPRNIQIPAILGLVMIVVAPIGGFCLSSQALRTMETPSKWD